MIDRSGLATEITESLPVRARWLARETPIDWNFSRGLSEPKAPTVTDFNFEPLPAEWLALLIIGEQSVSEGGGASPFIGVHKETGAVLGLDCENEASPIFLFNSTLSQFLRTFHLFDAALRTHTMDVACLGAEAAAIDPQAYPDSEWKLLAEYVVP